MIRTRSFVATAVALLVPSLVAVPSGGQAVPPGGAGFSAAGAATALYAGGMSGPAGPLSVRAGFSAAAVDASGLATPRLDELGATVASGAGTARRAEARGRGLEVGDLLTAGAAEAGAPPTSDLVADQSGAVDAPSVASASLARGEAAPAWSNRTCVAGRPMGFGSGRADQVVLPVARADSARSDTTIELQPADDGTFTLVAETRQLPAAIQVLAGTPEETLIEVLGETVLRVRADGQPGGAGVDYGPGAGAGTDTPFLRITRGKDVTQLTPQEVFGPDGLMLDVSPLVEVHIGGAPRGPGGTPTVGADGTEAGAIADLIRLTVLPNGPEGGAVDLRVGHLEAAVAVPDGGVRCPVPVSKVVDHDPVDPGQEFTFTITVPDLPDALDGLACDLAHLSAVDVVSADPGVDFTLLSTTGGGVIDGTTVTWPDLGDYHPGDPPLVVTLTGMMAPDSDAGAVSDTVRVTSGLTRCQGLPGGRTAPAGGAQLQGRASLVGPTLTR